MQEITFYCKKCKKSLKITYRLTGNDDAPVLPNINIVCHHCKRVMYLKKYTEKMLVENSVGGRIYIQPIQAKTTKLLYKHDIRP